MQHVPRSWYPEAGLTFRYPWGWGKNTHKDAAMWSGVMRIHVATAAAAACFLATSSASGADIAGSPEAEPVAVAYDWTGFYAGVHGGYATGDVSISDPAVELFNLITLGLTGEVAEYDLDGALGGVQVGAQIQHNRFVLGVEADVAWTGIEGDDELLNGTDIAPFLTPDDFRLGLRTEIDWLATFRARGGVTFDRFLIFATGGLAVADVTSGLTASSDGIPFVTGPFNVSFVDSETQLGWTAGAGVEAKLTEDLSVKAEYLYVDFEEQHYDVNLLRGLDVQGNTDIDLHTVRVGLNYRF